MADDNMICLQLTIPPMPVLLTVGHSVWPVGGQHFRRSFPVFDLLLVKQGVMHMTEDEQPYSIGAGEMLLLEPGRSHHGHAPCTEPTEIYWVHFRHDARIETIEHRRIPWSSMLRQGTDYDHTPDEQFLYLPKFGQVDMQALLPVLDEMARLHQSLCHENAAMLHTLLARLLALLQAGLRSRQSSRSFAVCEQVKQILQSRFAEPFQAERLAAELHFDVDYAARCLRKHTGMSPLKYQYFIRMEEAKRLLRHTLLSVQEIGSAVGFASGNYFIRTFRKTVGVTPGAYREKYRGLM
ncbi:helix-turn-helix transcriptional regulator [Paenibacillus thalictri]|uniref:AraC family transcriptional regulator n=1 Tax=Paenibacillus thalictri TaxID=2527873 RepID=A0A4Q9DM61_9BACL|nr:AraC family transcriptional regulator [Paenibacillus thalictri]TBL75132.1 AraC family transcriptional regulator [Paenibacillus thalictri]